MDRGSWRLKGVKRQREDREGTQGGSFLADLASPNPLFRGEPATGAGNANTDTRASRPPAKHELYDLFCISLTLESIYLGMRHRTISVGPRGSSGFYPGSRRPHCKGRWDDLRGWHSASRLLSWFQMSRKQGLPREVEVKGAGCAGGSGPPLPPFLPPAAKLSSHHLEKHNTHWVLMRK